MNMDIFRFITAGNIDDGKSTLTGRLLHDTQSLNKDIISSVSNEDEVNLAYIADGLRAERTQGITIDIAYKYIQTPTRKYIITDAPGHFQYTRNLVTGASNADAIIILIDARHGITEQTRRHSLVASFLKIKHIVVVVNKMDMLKYSQDIFRKIVKDYQETVQRPLVLPEVAYIPISALRGDNVMHASGNMPWYKGPTLMQLLDSMTGGRANENKFRMCIQYMNRSGSQQFCYGKIISGHAGTGDVVAIQPGNRTARVEKAMVHANGETDFAQEGECVCIFLKNDIAIERGDILCDAYDQPNIGTTLSVTLCWLDKTPLNMEREYVLQMNSFDTLCRVSAINTKADIEKMAFVRCANNSLQENEIATLTIECYNDVVYDTYSSIAAMGRGILIDKETNYTCGAFVID